MSDSEKNQIHALENQEIGNGYYTIVCNAAGVFITVFPHMGDGVPVDEKVVVSELLNRGIDTWDRAVLQKAVQEAGGQRIKIAEMPECQELQVQIRVSRDRMEASLEVTKPEGYCVLSVERVMEKVQQSGIVFGIDPNMVQAAVNQPGMDFIFARGRQPVSGKDAYIKLHFNPENKGKPLEKEDGRVDFKNLNLFTTVRPGDILAEKIPVVPGVNGMDVLGQAILAKQGKDIMLPIGKNVEVVDELKIAASIAGQALKEGNKITVSPVIQIKGDVDLSTGNIDFAGNVIVKGSVQAGFSIRADGDVEINGTVSGGTVEGHNVMIKMGIQGMNRGHIKASNNVIATFIENATVHAGNEILVTDVVLHSRISAGKKIIVEGRRGLITGGILTAGEEIRAQSIGNHMSIPTDLEVGVNPVLREEYQTLRKDYRTMQASLDQAQKALAILKAMDQAAMTDDKRAMMLKLTKAQFHLVGQINTAKQRMTEVEEALEEMKYGRIRAANSIYPGVKVMVGTLIKPIREILKFVTLYAEDGEIKMGVYK